MQAFTRFQAPACALPYINIDTDQIFPARFMKQPRSEGYDRYLFHGLRHDAEGRIHGEFPLDAPLNQGARILVARRNFGSGSSREAAVYALVDQGIRCVIAPSFGDIFASNAVNNGLLPARVEETEAELLLAALAPGGMSLAIDLEACRIMLAGMAEARPELSQGLAFQVDPVWRTKLLNGWDDIDITLRYEKELEHWLQADAGRRPWAWLP